MLAIGGGGEAGDTHVQADRGPGRFKGSSGYVGTRQDQHPAAPFLANLDRLDPALDLAVDGSLHVADPLQVHPGGLGPPAAAITVLGPCDAVEPVRRLEPRIAGRLAGAHPPEEAGEGPIQAAQGRLLGRKRPRRHIRSDRPDLLELCRLVPIGDTGSSQPPGVLSLLQGRVVQLPVRGQALSQGDMLAGGRPQPKRVRPPHTVPHCGSMRGRATTQKRVSVMTERTYPAGMTPTAVHPRPAAQDPTSLTANVASPLGAI
jgi:hypothetical protein